MALTHPPLHLHVFPVFHVGGAQVRFVNIANHFGRRARHVVVSIAPDSSCRERLAPELDAEIIHWPHQTNALARLIAIRRFITHHKPALLCTYSWNAIEWVAMNRIPPSVPNLHFEDGFSHRERIDQQFPRRIRARRALLRGPVTTLVPSRTLARSANRDWRLPDARIAFIPNGLDLERFHPRAPRGAQLFADYGLADLADGEGGVVIGTIAALRPEKNLGRLLRVFAAATRKRAATLVIFGDGDQRPALERYADELGVAARTRFVGAVARPEEALRLLDLFVLTSDTEQMPLSVMEAMAAGAPILATNVGDVPDMLPETARSFILAPEDEAAFAAALGQLIDDPAQRRALGDANRAAAEARFDQRAMFDAYESLFERMGAPLAPRE